MENNFKLGSKLRDTITGFTGIATAKVKYINGCVQYCLTPKAINSNMRPDGEYFDVQTLELVDDGVTFEEKATGGPQHDCPNRHRTIKEKFLDIIPNDCANDTFFY